MVAMLGPHDELLRTMDRQFPRVEINVRGNEFRLSGPTSEVALVERLIDELLIVIGAGHPLTGDAVERSIGMLRAPSVESPADVLTMNIVSNRGRTIRPKTLGQMQYVEAIDRHTVVFGIGPAGTGKTYLAMAKAVAALQGKQVNRIILTRPAVEAGERLGFLPGTLNDKIDPYLRPLYDALHDMVDPETIPRLMAAGTIEVAPLAYMRGRAQPYDATVLTPSGCVELGSLSVGDLVIGSDGQPTAVLGVYPQGVRPVYQVATVDGGRTLACGEHLWTVRADTGGAPGEWRTVDTRALAATLAAGMPGPELPIVGQGLSDAPGRPIASVAPAGALDTLCIKVAADDALYVTDDHIVTHNTLNDAFIILDEAQNTSPEQMKMFLTRLGFGSQMVITGDVTQVDLPGGTQSGLRVVQGILEGIEDVHFAHLNAADVVRHRLVGEIVAAYGRWDAAVDAHSGAAPDHRSRPAGTRRDHSAGEEPS